MKKLLVLMLVLGMASVANATLTLDITGGASDIGVASDVTFYPADNTNTFVVVDTTPGRTLTGGALTEDAPEASNVQSSNVISVLYPGALTSINAAISTAYGDTVSSDGIMGGLGTAVSAGVDAGLYMDSYVLGGGDAYVYLVHTPDWANYTAIDKQWVPEPATVVMLGLGGLFMLRRRKYNK
ncbi:MAG: PEP-CTERM sorting domain-containing protein [Planctomycetota bacterium]|nr:MAG: PEP-CTERM sorting domain-containing protein [Planctomycetota bacterium]